VPAQHGHDVLADALLAHLPEVPADRPRIVCLCGSTRFMAAFDAAGWAETMAGRIVLSVGVAKHVQTADGGHAGEALGPGVAEALDELHRRKIDLADDVLVVSDESGYYGDSTRGEIAYARSLGKPVRFLVTASEALDAGGRGCVCRRFADTGGYRVGDLTCPVHGLNGTGPLDGPWEADAGQVTP
jgi:hypothetical protein